VSGTSLAWPSGTSAAVSVVLTVPCSGSTESCTVLASSGYLSCQPSPGENGASPARKRGIARRETRGVQVIQADRSSGASVRGTIGSTGFAFRVSGWNGIRTGGRAGAWVTTVSVWAGAGRMTWVVSFGSNGDGCAPTPRLMSTASANAAPRGRSRREGAGMS